MDDATLEAFIKSYIESQDGDEIVFSWQGGEPTLLGLDYFKKIVELQNKYAKHGVRIENDLQTNGLLLNEAWCQFLHDHGFLVGLSIDGLNLSTINTAKPEVENRPFNASCKPLT